MVPLILIVLVSAAICYLVADRRGLHKPSWLAAGIVLGPVAIPFVLFWNRKDAE